MNNYRWLLILEDAPAPAGPGQRYRLWLVALDQDQPAAPVRCDSLDDVYQALVDRLQSSRNEQRVNLLPDSEAS